MATVSIILPNRNYADFIPDAIASIKGQTLKDFECIIIDDASTDNSVKIIRKLIKNDSRFKLVALDKPYGISHARNVGLDMASGEYIAFLDSDDCYTQYALEKLVDIARRENVDVVGGICNFVPGDFYWCRVSSNNKMKFDFSIETDFTKAMFKPSDQKWIWIWRRIYKRSFLNSIRFREELKVNGEDVLFALDIGYKMKKFVETEMVVVYHRAHPLQITKQGTNKERLSAFPIMLSTILKELFDKYDYRFLCHLYNDLFAYMCKECLFKKNISDEDKEFIRKIMRDSCKMIPAKYLPIKRRILCRYIACQ